MKNFKNIKFHKLSRAFFCNFQEKMILYIKISRNTQNCFGFAQKKSLKATKLNEIKKVR